MGLVRYRGRVLQILKIKKNLKPKLKKLKHSNPKNILEILEEMDGAGQIQRAGIADIKDQEKLKT